MRTAVPRPGKGRWGSCPVPKGALEGNDRDPKRTPLGTLLRETFGHAAEPVCPRRGWADALGTAGQACWALLDESAPDRQGDQVRPASGLQPALKCDYQLLDRLVRIAHIVRDLTGAVTLGDKLHQTK